MSIKKARAKQKLLIEQYNRYRNGGEGLCLWAEENVRVPIYRIGSTFAEFVYIKDLPDEIWPETGRSYATMWQEQKKIFCDALRMENGEFLHRLIVFCWPRGEGKSFMTILVQLWRFFCWPKQKIVLCSNSKDLSGFLLFEEMQSMILNSPKLLKNVGGKKNIQEKGIRRKNKVGDVVSQIQTISSASGIVSNATGYSFTEFFDNKYPKFFEKLDTSMRNTPNALGVIDTTVSSKAHKLYGLYRVSVKKKDPLLYFSYRFSKDGNFVDYWHPRNSQVQLNSFKVKHPMGGFARMFQNLWSAGAERVFSSEQVDAFNYIGADGSVNCHNRVIELLRRRQEILDSDIKLRADGVNTRSRVDRILKVDSRLWAVEDVYKLRSNGVPVLPQSGIVDRLTDIYDTEWAVVGGIDRADPMKKRTAARTIMAFALKGLPGSLSDPMIGRQDNNDPDLQSLGQHKTRPEESMPSLKYIYFLLHVADVEDHSLEKLKSIISYIYDEFDGIDALGGERYGLWDLIPWAESQSMDIKFDIVHPNYKLQLAFFTYLFSLINTGMFKGPPTGLPGSRLDDLVKEEMMYFDHDDETRWFGSPEKKLKHGVQDDYMFAVGQALFSGRTLGVEDFRSRRGSEYWGTMMQPGSLVGNW